MNSPIRLAIAGFFLLAFLFTTTNSCAQQNEITKWEAILDSVQTDSLKFNALIRLFSLHSRSNIELSREYLDRAYKIAQRQTSPFFTGTVSYQRAAYFNFKGMYDSTFVYANRACELLKNTPFRRAYALALGNLSTSLGAQNEKKIEILRQVEEIYIEIKDTTGLIWTWNTIANNFTYLNKFDSALVYTEKSLVQARILKDNFRISSTLGKICNIYFEQHKFDEAIKIAYEALEYSKKSNNKNDEIWLYVTLANIFYHQNNFERSHEYYDRALELSLSAGIGNKIARIYLEKGNVFLLQENYKEARNYFSKAYDAAVESKSDYFVMASHSGNADLYYELKDYKQSLKHALTGMEMCKIQEAKTDIPYFYFLAGMNYYHLGNIDSAYFYADKGYNESQAISDNKKLMENAELLSLIFEKKSDYNKALFYFKEYKAFQDSIYNADKAKIIVESETKFQTAQKQEQIQRLLSEQQINKLKLERKEQQLILEASKAQRKADELELERKAGQIKDLELSEIKLNKNNQEQQLLLNQSELEMSKKNLEMLGKIADKEKSLRNVSLLAVLITLIAGYLLFIFFSRKKQNEKKLSLIEERLRISRELHDDLGSTLSSISVYSDVAKNRALKNAGNEEVLNKISYASRDLIDKMSDIVWSLNPGNETVDQLKNRMLAFAAMILSPNGISFRFDFDEDLLPMILSPEKRKNLFLIFKEAIHNIVKHAKATNVLVSLHKTGNGMHLIVSDDGIGFPALKNGNGLGGNGLHNLKSRAADIGGELKLTSNSPNGAVVSIQFS